LRLGWSGAGAPEKGADEPIAGGSWASVIGRSWAIGRPHGLAGPAAVGWGGPKRRPVIGLLVL